MRKKLLLPALLLSQILWGQNAADLSNQTSVMVNSQDEYEMSTNNDRATPILNETFESISGNDIPSGWGRWMGLMDNVLYHGVQPNPSSTAENHWGFVRYNDNELVEGIGLSTGHMAIGTITNSINDWLFTPSKQATAGSYCLSFDASYNKHKSINAPDLSATDDIFAILYKVGNGNWQLLAKWDNQVGSERVLNSLDQFPQTITLPINVSQNTTLRVAFYVESTINNSNNMIHIDNVSIWKTTGNNYPSNIYVTEKSKNSALINWDMPEGTNTCNLQYKKVNSFSSWNTIPNISASSYLLTDLEPETYYRVRLCSNNAQGESIWSDALVFKTALNYDDYTIPFTEIFTSTSIPQQWKLLTDPVEYVYSCGGYHPKDGQNVSGRWSCTNNGNSFGRYHAYAYCRLSNTTWLVTPNIDLSSANNSNNLCLIFDVELTKHLQSTAPAPNIPDDDDEFRIMISTDGGESWLPENNVITWKNGSEHSFDEIRNGQTTVRIPLNEFANKTVMIGFYCSSKTGTNGFDLHIDNIFVGEASHIFLTDGNWNVAQNWQGNIMPNSPSNSVLLKADATIPAGYTAHVSSVAMADGSLTISDGGQLIHDNEGVVATIQKSITKFNSDSDGWQLISHPMSTEIEAENVTHLMENIYDLYAFDINESSEWRNFKSGNNLTALNANEGYLYSTDTNKTLSFNGTLNPANEVALDNLKYNGNARLKGFNLIGNPFACNAVVNRPTYVMNDAHNNIIVASNYEIAPNEAVFVSVTSDNRTVTITPAYLNQANGNGNGICIEVRKADNTRGQGVLDRALINFSEQDNLEKFTLNANATKVYIPLDGEDFAVLQAQEEGEMPINFKAEDNGNYVLNIYPENMEMSYLHLIDNLTGVETDLLENPNYTFDSKTTDYASRFRLVYSADGNKENFESFAYCSGNTLKINSQDNAIVQVIDILGHVLSSETINGNCEKDMNLCPGVYILRLVSNNSVKTQKIVIE